MTIEGNVGTIKINRPKTLNSLVGEVYTELIKALREMAENPQVVVTVLTGEGRFFSSGADVKAGAQRRADGPRPEDMTVEDKVGFSSQGVCWTWNSRRTIFQALASLGGLTWALLIGRAFIEHPKLLVFALWVSR